MAQTKLANAVLKDADLIFKNFSGREDAYNREGNRNFSIRLEEEIALAMIADGWNARPLKRREDDAPEDPNMYSLKVAVSFKIRAPQIYLVTGNSKTLLTEEMLSLLDDVQIVKADVMLSPTAWEVNGNTGIKAYLAKAYITIQEDELDADYSDLTLQGA